jgi:hypothetical protein
MTVAGGAVANPSPKYRNAIAVRSVSGGQAMNILTVPGVSNEPLKAALEGTLAANGYLAQSAPAKFYLDAEIQILDQPLIGLDLDVTADVTYRIYGGDGSLPIRSRPKAARRSPGSRLPPTACALRTNARRTRTSRSFYWHCAEPSKMRRKPLGAPRERIAGRPADYASSNIPAPPEVPPQRECERQNPSR